MRFLGVGETNDLGDMYLRLMRDGHEVRVHMSDADSHGVMQDMIEFVDDWRSSLGWIREAGSDGIMLFETANLGKVQDELRRNGLNVIGGSELGDRLENDRVYGQQVLRSIGLETAVSHAFGAFDEAIAFLRESPGRFVFKLNGSNWASTRTYVGQMDNGADMIALLSTMRHKWPVDAIPDFMLMQHVTGVEVGVGAFFDGERFLEPANLDWEYKRFFPGDIGELTGEMGTVVTYRGAERLFDATLARLAPLLRESGYCGYINLNTIINEKAIYPLEFTCRFGYPGFCILDSLHAESWASLFGSMVRKDQRQLRTKPAVSVGVVLTVPSFPYREGFDELGKGTPISLRDTMNDADMDGLHYGEVTLSEGQLVTAGMVGYVMVVTGVAETIDAARGVAYDRVGKVVIPNMRYRNDIGARHEDDCARLRSFGWLD